MVEADTLRTATPDDEREVTQLLTASYPVLMKGAYEEAVLERALPLMTKANPTLLASGTFYLAETLDGEVVGCGGWTKERPGSDEIEDGLAHIRHFATHPAWTRKGVGKSIFNHCRKQAGKAGFTCLEVYTSLNAELFYQSVGMKSVGPFDVPMGEGLNFPSVRMIGAINSAP